jgi:RNA recognition motif-containing protein
MIKLQFGPVRKKAKKSTKTKIIKTSNESNKEVMIYVGNLNYKRDESSVEALFKKFGKVESVKILFHEGTELKSGVAFVKMTNSDCAKRAIDTLNGKIVDGRTLKVSIANSRF